MKHKTLGAGWYIGFLAIGGLALYRGITDVYDTASAAAYFQFIIGVLIILGASYQLYKTFKDR